MTAIKGVDYSHHAFTGAQLKAAGIAFACRYIENAPVTPIFDKEMKATELASLTAAGVRVVANWEWGANPANDRALGKSHATNAKARLAALHVPDWAPIYYSIDSGLEANTRNAYAQGWRDIYPAEQLGVYTCGALFRQLKADGYVTKAWQSMSRSFPGNHHPDGTWDHSGADIIQTGNGSLLGHALDWDTAVVEDYGGFLMGEADPNMALTPDDKLWITSQLNLLLADKDVSGAVWHSSTFTPKLDAASHPVVPTVYTESASARMDRLDAMQAYVMSPKFVADIAAAAASAPADAAAIAALVLSQLDLVQKPRAV